VREGVLTEWIKIGEEISENSVENMFLCLNWIDAWLGLIDAVPPITFAHAFVGRVDTSTFVTKTTTTPAI